MSITHSDQFDGYTLKTTTLSTYDSAGGVNLVKLGGGFLHAITFAQMDAAPTAGDITIYDSARTNIYGSGDRVIFRHSQTTAVFMPVTVTLDVPFTNGLAVGFTAPIKDVGVTLSFK